MEIVAYDCNLIVIELKNKVYLLLFITRISIHRRPIWIADYACILKNKRGNVVDIM